MDNLDKSALKAIEVLNYKILQYSADWSWKPEENEGIDIAIYRQDLALFNIDPLEIAKGLSVLQQEKCLVIEFVHDPVEAALDPVNDYWQGSLMFSVIAAPSVLDLFSKFERRQAKLNFDSDTGVLTFGNKQISVQKFSDQYHLLRVIFENREEAGKEWFFSEIAEKVDPSGLNEKRYYNAAYQIKQKLKQIAPDALITTKQSVKINSSFLP